MHDNNIIIAVTLLSNRCTVNFILVSYHSSPYCHLEGIKDAYCILCTNHRWLALSQYEIMQMVPKSVRSVDLVYRRL